MEGDYEKWKKSKPISFFPFDVPKNIKTFSGYPITQTFIVDISLNKFIHSFQSSNRERYMLLNYDSCTIKAVSLKSFFHLKER